MKVWFKQDDTFNQPKACLLFEITRYRISKFYLLAKMNKKILVQSFSAETCGSNFCIDQYFSVTLFIFLCKLVLTFGSVD